MLQISDSGVGMSPDELEEANWRLANPPTIDVSVSRRMGLFVVGRLAQRHGIRVELRAALSGGLTAFVILRADRDHAGPGQGQAPADRRGLGRSRRPAGGSAADRTGRDLPARRARRGRARCARPPVPDTPREPVRSHSSPLPKRKPAPTSPPGRGSGSTAPSRSSRPQGAPRGQVGRPAAEPAAGAASSPAAVRPSRAGGAGRAGLRRECRAVNENNGRSPIFEAMQSEWFQRRKTGSMSRAESSPPREWSSPGDEGWRAAETIRAPATGGQTNTGLPKRVPGSNRIPGSVGSAPDRTPSSLSSPLPSPLQPAQARSAGGSPRPPQAEAVRNRFASFQQGVRKGRAAIRPEDDERENQ